MQDTIKIGTAALGGYVLGRTRKAKAAIGLALWLSGRGRMRDMARDQAAKLLSSERGQELLTQLRGPLLGTGKQAALSLFESQAGRLSDTLHSRTEKLGALAPTGRAAPSEDEEEDVEGEEPEEYEDELEEEEPEEELEEGESEEEEPADEYEYEDELEEEEPEEEEEVEEPEEENGEYEDEYAEEEGVEEEGAEDEGEPERPSAPRRRNASTSSRSPRRAPSRRDADRPSRRRSRQSTRA